jgi:hypothetical protein
MSKQNSPSSFKALVTQIPGGTQTIETIKEEATTAAEFKVKEKQREFQERPRCGKRGLRIRIQGNRSRQDEKHEPSNKCNDNDV